MNAGGKQINALLHHGLRGSAARFPGKEAIVHGDRRMTYAEVWTAVASLASRLKSGLERGERLGIFLEPSIPQALSIFAASAADVVFVPIHHSLFPEQVGHILSDCGAKGLITTRGGWRDSRMSSKEFLLLSLFSSRIGMNYLHPRLRRQGKNACAATSPRFSTRQDRLESPKE
jgi:acyl-CoA synthetase (AMP-forming)/AMP-acid ligase II